MQEGDGEEEHGPGGVVGVVQGVLRHVGVGALQAGPDALRWLVRELDGHLQEADGEPGVNLRRQPDAEVGVDLRGGGG